MEYVFISHPDFVNKKKTKHGLFFERTLDKRCNKFGNQYSYAIHKLPESSKQKAIDLYYKLNG